MYDDVPFDVFDEYDDDLLTQLYQPEDKPGMVDTATANFYVGIVKRNKEKEVQYEEQAKQMIDLFKVRVENWLAQRKRSLDYSTQHCMDKLRVYWDNNLPSTGKSISLPEGNIGFYKVPEKYDFDSHKDEIIKALEESEETKQYIRYTPAVNKKDIKKACSYHDGSVYIGDQKLPLVGYTPATQEFKVR